MARYKHPFFREGKADICVICKDIRHTNKLKNPESVRVSVWTPAAANGVKQEVQQTGLKLHQKNVYGEKFVEINIGDSAEAAERIVECILDKCEMISSIIDEICKE